MNLNRVENWFLDLDGTVYLDEQPLPGALELIEFFRRQGTGYCFLTNNSSRAASDYVARLRRLGFDVADDQVFTSGGATANYLRREMPNARVYLLGTPALAAELQQSGVQLVDEDADTVLLGFDPSLDFARLTRACNLLRNDEVRFLATNPDANCPTGDGFIPDAGSVMALIETSTGRRPFEVIGKPNPRFIAEAADRMGVPLERCAMVGDRLETDLTMATEVGIPGVLVLSGATKGDDERLRGRDDLLVVRGLDELLEQLTGKATGQSN